MPQYAELVIYGAIVVVAAVAYLIRRHRREASKPPRGVADAYDGNVVILPPGRGRRGVAGFRSSPRTGHTGHGHGHAHVSGHHPGGGH